MTGREVRGPEGAAEAGQGVDEGGGQVAGQGGCRLAGVAAEGAAEGVVADGDAGDVPGEVAVAEGVALQAGGGRGLGAPGPPRRGGPEGGCRPPAGRGGPAHPAG